MRLNIPDGVVGILGANGAGKSTLIEAIAWALYGSGGRNSDIIRDGKDGIKNYNASPKEECSVKIVFDLNGTNYELVRSLKGKNNTPNAYLLADGIPTANSDSAVTEKIEKLLGMESKEFFISVFSRQKDLSALSELNASKRKEHIVKLLDIDILQDVVKNVSIDLNFEKHVKDDLESNLKNPDGELKKDCLIKDRDSLIISKNEIIRELSILKEKEAELQNKKNEASEELEKLDAVYRKYIAAKNAADSKKKEIEIETGHLQSLDMKISDLNRKLEKLPELELKYRLYEEMSHKKEVLDEDRMLFQRRNDIILKLDRLDQNIKSHQAKEAEILTELEKYSGVSSEIDKNTEQISEIEEKINEINIKIHEVDAALKENNKIEKSLSEKISVMRKRGPDSVCPECERTLGEHHTILMNKLQTELQEVSETIKTASEEKTSLVNSENEEKIHLTALKKRKTHLEEERKKGINHTAELKSVRNQVKDLEEERKDAENSLTSIKDVKFDSEEYQKITDDLKSLKKSSDEYNGLKGESRNLPNFMQEKKDNEDRIVRQKDELARLLTDLQNIDYDDEAYQSVKLSVKAAEEECSAIQKEINEKQTQSAVIDERIDNKAREIKEVEKTELKQKESLKKISELAALRDIFSDLKDNLMERIIPALTDIASSMFSDMTDGRYLGLELDDEYNISVYDGDAKYPINRFSGGEMDLANLCLRLAISRLLSDRSGKDINFLVLDEIFGSQDQNRKRNIMTALSKLENQFSQILLITHIDDVKDLMRNVISVYDSKEGESVAELISL
ncbi:hypothetical protein A3206_00180 [Candidatus Methanomassiliicoccus intestinalis]|nr:MAG: hypothetical protein A3206_00180 [Candidatus Methanomassiliicoccus intestinalis]